MNELRDMSDESLNQKREAIERELADIADMKVTLGTDPATREAKLLDELDWIDFEEAIRHYEQTH